jgi:hypothetical protein
MQKAYYTRLIPSLRTFKTTGDIELLYCGFLSVTLSAAFIITEIR